MHWLLTLVAKLPLGFLQGFGACIGELVFWLSPGYRRRTRDNLRHAGYNEAKFFTKVGVSQWKAFGCGIARPRQCFPE